MSDFHSQSAGCLVYVYNITRLNVGSTNLLIILWASNPQNNPLSIPSHEYMEGEFREIPLKTMRNLYESDFYAWTQEQAKVLKSQAWAQLDTINLIEEIESLGRRERQELRSRFEILVGHLLKWQYQPEAHSNSWLATIREQRRKIQRLLQESPSLKPYLKEALQQNRVYPRFQRSKAGR